MAGRTALVAAARPAPPADLFVVLFVTMVGWGKNALCDSLRRRPEALARLARLARLSSAGRDEGAGATVDGDGERDGERSGSTDGGFHLVALPPLGHVASPCDTGTPTHVPHALAAAAPRGMDQMLVRLALCQWDGGGVGNTVRSDTPAHPHIHTSMSTRTCDGGAKRGEGNPQHLLVSVEVLRCAGFTAPPALPRPLPGARCVS